SGVNATVYEEVAFGPMNLGLPRSDVVARTQQALETLRIGDLAMRDPSRLSGGQLQLVAIAGLLAMRAAHLILDEPTAELDPDGAVRALDGVDLTIRPGERVAVVGQNGSGKTTLVRHLNGLLRPTAGHVLVDGVDAAGFRVAQLARRVGLVFQDPDRQIFAAT